MTTLTDDRGEFIVNVQSMSTSDLTNVQCRRIDLSP
jgi:hypothetical protein